MDFDFENFYIENINSIYRYFFLRTGSENDSLDLCQETFLKVLRNKKLNRGYLFKTANSALIDYFRTKKNTFHISDSIFEPIFENEDNIFENMDFDFLKNVISESLNYIEKSVVELKILEKLTFKEASKMIQKSESATKMIFFRSIEKIKNKISSILFGKNY